MRSVNPLHVLGLLVVSAVFMFVELQKVKNELKEEEKIYMTSKHVAQELLAYKKLFGDKKRVYNALKKITSQRSLKNAHLKISSRENSIRIASKSMDLQALNSFLSKLLNGTYLIQSLRISRIDPKHVSLDVEVTW